MPPEFPLWHSGLGIWRCWSCDVGCSCCSDLISGLGISICHGCDEKKTLLPHRGVMNSVSIYDWYVQSASNAGSVHRKSHVALAHVWH